ncbi:MAG: aldehyde ferredoxin oxidoreductase N-terminal domain-containing protein [Candidatus Omnitrophota bacterium]
MQEEKIAHMQKARKIRREFPFEVKELYRGYADRFLRIDVDNDEITIHPVTQEMKDLWTGGKGLDLWLMFKEITKDTKWDSPENPICFSPGPLGGATSFPGSGKTLVTALSPLTSSVIDCNVGGYFGPYLKFAGFDALVIVGKAKEETIIYFDAVNQKITIETAPEESIDSHLIAEELTEMVADDDLDKRNIAVVSAGRGAQYTRMGILNFSFWDWRRNVARLKQAGRGGIGRVFRDKMLKALVIKNRDITPAWRVEENKVAKSVRPKTMATLCSAELEHVNAIIEKWGNDPEFAVEILQDIQDRFHFISVSAMDRVTQKTGVPKAYLYHIATFDTFFTLEKQDPAAPQPTENLAFHAKGEPIVFRNRGKNDAYGYTAFKKVIKENPEAILEVVKNSGLRARCSGAPLGEKWITAYNTKNEKNVAPCIICAPTESLTNAVIGPSIIETDPHAVIESMLIHAYAIGADEGIIVLGKDHATAKEMLQKAIDKAKEDHLLGQNIQGTGLNFDITIHRFTDSYVLGEPTSLIAALSGKAGDARAKYIPLEESGYHGKPTLVADPETMINIPAIIEKGAPWFASVGTAASAGSKVFVLTGNVKNPGLVEVPMGTSLREIVETIGGGTATGKKLKAIQLGGHTGPFIPAAELDMTVDFDALKALGFVLGSGQIAVFDEDACMLGETRARYERLMAESCGKCTPCREGLFAIKNILDRIIDGQGQPADLQSLEDLSKTMNETSLCNFGSIASQPITSILRYYRHGLTGNVEKKRCGCAKRKAK